MDGAFTNALKLSPGEVRTVEETNGRTRPRARTPAGGLGLDDELFRFSPSSADAMALGDCCQGILVLGENGSGKTSAAPPVASCAGGWAAS